MSSSYADALAEFSTLPSFSPLLPTTSLPSLAALSLIIAFALSFYFSTLRSSSKSTFPAQELAVAGAASVSGGFGLVLAFCAIGANV
ncbi:hypothetical protein JCM11641_006478 [Rhodosporidiobolus odoratus]